MFYLGHSMTSMFCQQNQIEDIEIILKEKLLIKHIICTRLTQIFHRNTMRNSFLDMKIMIFESLGYWLIKWNALSYTIIMIINDSQISKILILQIWYKWMDIMHVGPTHFQFNAKYENNQHSQGWSILKEYCTYIHWLIQKKYITNIYTHVTHTIVWMDHKWKHRALVKQNGTACKPELNIVYN